MLAYVKKFVITALNFLLFGTACCYAEQSMTGFSCLQQLDVPRYPLLARQARLNGVVELRVRVGPKGVAKKSTRLNVPKIFAAHRLLQEAVSDAAARASFSRSCAGQDIVIEFAFEIDQRADAQQVDSGIVTLQAPNRITIRAAPFPMSGSVRETNDPDQLKAGVAMTDHAENLAPTTEVTLVAKFYRKRPDLISEEEVVRYLLHRKNTDRLAPTSMRICYSGLRFFYQRVLGQEWKLLVLLRARRELRRPSGLSRAEVHRILEPA